MKNHNVSSGDVIQIIAENEYWKVLTQVEVKSTAKDMVAGTPLGMLHINLIQVLGRAVQVSIGIDKEEDG